jgi:hypothetical protein
VGGRQAPRQGRRHLLQRRLARRQVD